MEVKHTQNSDGIITRHIIETSYHSLKELEKDYQNKGFETIFQLFDACQGKWCLSVTIPFLN